MTCFQGAMHITISKCCNICNHICVNYFIVDYIQTVLNPYQIKWNVTNVRNVKSCHLDNEKLEEKFIHAKQQPYVLHTNTLRIHMIKCIIFFFDS